jgi:hypothetical protein
MLGIKYVFYLCDICFKTLFFLISIMHVQFGTWAEICVKCLLLQLELNQVWTVLTDFSYTS